jgi:hypothetical protein
VSISVKPSILGVHIPQGVPGAGPHLHWRIYVTATQTNVNAVGIADLQLYNAAGTLLSTGGIATVSSFFQSDPTYNADKAFDGSVTTFWNSNIPPSTTPQWIAYQMPAPGEVAVIRLTPRGGSSFITTQSPSQFKLQYSDDGSAWFDAQSYVTSWSNEVFAHSFSVGTPAAGAYCNWRIVVLANQSGTAPSGAEVQLRETPGGPDLSSPLAWHGMSSDAFGGGFTGEKAFDNSLSTIWAAANPPPNNWLMNCLSRTVAIVEITWQARNDGFYTQSPTSFKMQGSNDGMNWTDAWNGTFATWTAAAQIQTATKP